MKQNQLLRKAYGKIKVFREARFIIRFIKRNKYFPAFKNPKTFNEKINYRKSYPKNDLFTLCSDKIQAKEWVAQRIGEKYIIPNYYLGESITPEILRNIIKSKGDCLVKCNHNSGAVHLLTKDSSEQSINAACDNIMQQLKVDFGKLQKETWYSKIKPRVLVEKRLYPENGESDIRDYKFHVFSRKCGSQKVILHVDFDRNSNHSRTFFDEDLNWLPFFVRKPCIHTAIEEPANYRTMVELAKVLARPFSYARIDLYNVGGKIYFGEITFAHGSGLEHFSSYEYDYWMGSLWECDPSF